MHYITCGDIVSLVIDEAGEQFTSGVSINEHKKENLFKLCEELDTLTEKYGIKRFDASVDKENGGITLSLLHPSIWK
jgi:predicted mannosyl-3-phosphoglycerate phosphatase (HAD superfamily)